MAASRRRFPGYLLVVSHKTEEVAPYLTVDEFEITRALRITVANAVFRTGFVGGVFLHSAISIHGNEVQGSVKSAWKVRYVHIESELVVQELELGVRCISIHEIQTRTNIGSIGALGDESKLQRVAARGSSVSSRVVRAFQSTVRSTFSVVWAQGRVPCISSVAIGVAVRRLVVYPTPIGINYHLSLLSSTSPSRSALLPCHRGMGLGLLRAYLLAAYNGSDE